MSVRVNLWIVPFFSDKAAIHEVARNKHETRYQQNRFLTQSLTRHKAWGMKVLRFRKVSFCKNSRQLDPDIAHLKPDWLMHIGHRLDKHRVIGDYSDALSEQ